MFLRSRYDLVTNRPGRDVCDSSHTVVYGGPGQGKTRFLINDLKHQLTISPSSWALFLDNEVQAAGSIHRISFSEDMLKRIVLIRTQLSDNAVCDQSLHKDFGCLYIDNFDLYHQHTQESFRDVICKTKRVCISSSIALGNKIPRSWEEIILSDLPVLRTRLAPFRNIGGNAGSIF
jgi:hypothetical protein